MTSTRPLGRLALVALLASLVPDTTASSPREIWDALHSPRLDPTRAVRVEALEIDMGPGGFHLMEGVLLPAVPVAGRTMEMVFLGRGSFRMDPPDAIEEAQLELFTGSTSLDVAVDQAVLVVASEEVAARLLKREAPVNLAPDLLTRAEKALAGWAASAERKGFGAEGAMFKAAVGDARHRAYFAAQVHSAELGDFYYVLDPSSFEQATLGQFVPIDADYLEEGRIRRELKKQQRNGRLSQLRFDDLGDWDTWVSTSLSDDAGEKRPGSSGFEAEHYELDITISPRETHVGGRARLRARAERAGLRVATLQITPDVKVLAVRDGSGRAFPTFRSRGECHVVLTEATRAEQVLTFDVEFGGPVLDEIDTGVYALQDSYGWYPHLGDVDRATYDVTLRWPRKLELLAGGRRVDGGVTNDTAWEKRTIDLPTIAYSFEVGAFDVQKEQVGHVDLTVGFSKAAGSLDPGAKDDVLATLREALPFYEERFGAYPFDYLTIATVPRGFSQGLLGFLTLSHHLIWTPKGGQRWVVMDPLETRAERRRIERIETVAHELAHQWWGNRVGWVSYRDQWLSEALADYSATWFTAMKSEQPAVYLARHAVRWHGSVNASTEESRRIETLGPVVLGTRLSSSRSAGAYHAIVYDKGSVVLSMLDRMVGEARFAEMLRTLAEAVNNRVIDTPTFLKALEKMSGADLKSFADQFIYGTGMPEIHYTYDFKPEGDGWVIEGEAEQISRATYRHRLFRISENRWDVQRVPIQGAQPESMAMIVPFQVAVVGAKDRSAVDPSVPESRWKPRVTVADGFGGSLTLLGARTSFRIPSATEPRGFWLDQRGEVLAVFQSEKRRPKFGLKRKGSHLVDAGRLEEAEAVFRQALAAQLVPETGGQDTLTKKEADRTARRLDVETHLALSELYLDLGRDPAAKGELEAAEGLLTRMEQTAYLDLRLVLAARLALRAGDYDETYALLSKNLRLDFPVRKEDTMSDVARRQKFRSGRRMRLGGDAYAMLAAAAHETGRPDVAAEARREAEERGAEIDLSPL